MIIQTLAMIGVVLLLEASLTVPIAAEERTPGRDPVSRVKGNRSPVTKSETPVATPITVAPSPDSTVAARPMPRSTVPISVSVARASDAVIKWQVMASGGGITTSANFNLGMTVGQVAAGSASSPGYSVNQGFWQNFLIETGCCLGTVGNADGDPGDGCDLSDLQVYIDYLFFAGAPADCMDEFDTIGGDGTVDISDLQVIVDYLFFGGSLQACP